MHTAPDDLEVDVIVVGYGPTGLVLTSLLGQQGHRVAVVERWPVLYGKPRLTHIDGETARLISLVADGEHALREAWTTPQYRWVNGKGQLLIDVAAGNTRRMLWDDHISVHQPHIEDAIHERIVAMPQVRLVRGHVATGLEQGAEGVVLSCRPWHKGVDPATPVRGELRLRARYLVGADGSKSFVRDSLGITRTDFGFNERWLCADTEPQRPLPAKFDQNAVQVCDPKRGHMFMPIGRRRQRFEFALLPGETTEAMASPDAAYRLLAHHHGLVPDDVTLIRQLVYTFECRLADRWRAGRVFLAGDAAHTNPPYLGQGACSGMRDAANLAWKFDLVLRGLAGDALLDSYEAERRPHARQLMLDARALGLVANTANPVKAAVRDLLFRFKLTPKPTFPVLVAGVLAPGRDGKPMREAGTLPPQGHLGIDGRTLRFDEHVGFHFALLAAPGVLAQLASPLKLSLQALGVRLLDLGAEAVVDTDGVYTRLLALLQADAVLVRPDFVLYGHARREALPALVEALLHQLQGTAVQAEAASA